MSTRCCSMTARSPGICDRRRASPDTVDAIAAIQLPDGNIPWMPGHHTDPWNLVEAAMALDVGGRHARSRARRTSGSASRQRPDGAWHAYYVGDAVKDPTLDTNVTCYIANGAWHHYLSHAATGASSTTSGPSSSARSTSRSTTRPRRARSRGGATTPTTARCSPGRRASTPACAHAIAIAEHLGHERPDWELSLGSLAIAVAHRPDVFLDKARWAMDWYYPILGGVLRGHAAHARVAAGWKTFVVEGRGVRCVSDRPWVTAAETCELVMALDAIGAHDEAHELFEWVQFLRADGGGYWTGANFEGERVRSRRPALSRSSSPRGTPLRSCSPPTRSAGDGPTAGLFRGEGLPLGLTPEELLAAGAEIEAERVAVRR